MNSSTAFIDTNVILYWASADERKASIAQDILAAEPALSVQVLNEFVEVSRRKQKATWLGIEQVLRSVKVLCPVIVPLSLALHERAVRIAQETNLRTYDACIIAAAEISGCDVLYTEDMNHGQRIGSVTLRNPFA